MNEMLLQCTPSSSLKGFSSFKNLIFQGLGQIRFENVLLCITGITTNNIGSVEVEKRSPRFE